MKRERNGKTIIEDRAEEELRKRFEYAGSMLNEPDRVERLLQRLENKLKSVPKIGDQLAMAPILASLVKSYIQKEYTDLPVGTIVAAISAILYVVSPVDLIPDAIPGIGHIDDALVIAACIALISTDLDEYTAWRKTQGKEIVL